MSLCIEIFLKVHVQLSVSNGNLIVHSTASKGRVVVRALGFLLLSTAKFDRAVSTYSSLQQCVHSLLSYACARPSMTVERAAG